MIVLAGVDAQGSVEHGPRVRGSGRRSGLWPIELAEKAREIIGSDTDDFPVACGPNERPCRSRHERARRPARSARSLGNRAPMTRIGDDRA
jgi:hypothetical protein